MRHKMWDQVIDYLGLITKNIGHSIKDKRCGRVWDVGQAVCAEAYGPGWMRDDTFIEYNNKDDDEPPERHYYETAKRMAEGYCPEWVDRGDVGIETGEV